MSAPPPVLHEAHVRNCRLLPNRLAILDHMSHHGVVAELGVGWGDFSAQILEVTRPREFHAVDLFGWHDVPTVWGCSTREILRGRTHENFYRDRFATHISKGTMRVQKGLSWEVLSRCPDASFDVIYIDAGHDRESVTRDATCSVRKLKPDGFLIFNDYTMFDHVAMEPYGVVHAVNDLCVTQHYEMAYFAMHELMFCDVVLRKMR